MSTTADTGSWTSSWSARSSARAASAAPLPPPPPPAPPPPVPVPVPLLPLPCSRAARSSSCRACRTVRVARAREKEAGVGDRYNRDAIGGRQQQKKKERLKEKMTDPQRPTTSAELAKLGRRVFDPRQAVQLANRRKIRGTGTGTGSARERQEGARDIRTIPAGDGESFACTTSANTTTTTSGRGPMEEVTHQSFTSRSKLMSPHERRRATRGNEA